jgi:hypothetical protein
MGVVRQYTGGAEMKVKEIEKKYRDEWVLAEVLKENELGELIEVRVIAHSKNRDDTYAAMRKAKGKYTYHFYTGKIPKKGYAVAFYVKI